VAPWHDCDCLLGTGHGAPPAYRSAKPPSGSSGGDGATLKSCAKRQEFRSRFFEAEISSGWRVQITGAVAARVCHEWPLSPTATSIVAIPSGRLTSIPAGRNAQIALKNSALIGAPGADSVLLGAGDSVDDGRTAGDARGASTASASSGMSRIPGAPPRDFERAHGLAISRRPAGTG
jgi:hypothetical protein